ncbi:MAG: cyclase family protein [Phycisphaerae bacterium]|nr:cyclase family protein [Phycisphaerae bacterium]MDW8261157.1 cyclase family protein [Phycisphaerales bacterium]
MLRVSILLILPFVLIVGGCQANRPPTIDPKKMIDLTYSFGPQTIYWPTAEPFQLRRVAYGRTSAGYFYYANNISAAEHGGTHMDAPLHFAEGRITTEKVPLTNCVGPAVVIDVRQQAASDPDYRVTVEDVLNWEKKHGRLPPGSIVVMNSGWGSRWPDRKRYLGTDAPGDVANLHFPGFSREAAELLLTRDIAALAVDTPSIDHGQSKDFIVHQIVHSANKPAFENVANVDRLPPKGATIIALPMKIENGSGGPTRIVALLP